MMYSADVVAKKLEQMKTAGLRTKAEMVWELAGMCVGWPYVYGAVGEICNPSTRRKYYNNYASRDPGEAEQIKKKCYVLSGRSSCSGCPYYPSNCTVRCFDCRGFTRWVLGQVGITLMGAGATSQWNNDSNWSQKGRIEDLPEGVVACFFHQNGNKMSHTGFCFNGITTHCSGTVKQGLTTDRGITHYAIPAGLNGNIPATKPTIRKGDRGEYVTYLQTKLIQMGYSCGSTGADGKFGNDTLYAVKKFQLDHGLQMDGIVGPATWGAIDSDEPVKLYTVHIPGQAKYVADAFIKEYSGAWMTEDGE